MTFVNKAKSFGLASEAITASLTSVGSLPSIELGAPKFYPKEKPSKEYQKKAMLVAKQKREKRNRRNLINFAKQETRSLTFKSSAEMAKLKQAVAFTGYFARLKAPNFPKGRLVYWINDSVA